MNKQYFFKIIYIFNHIKWFFALINFNFLLVQWFFLYINLRINNFMTSVRNYTIWTPVILSRFFYDNFSAIKWGEKLYWGKLVPQSLKVLVAKWSTFTRGPGQHVQEYMETWTNAGRAPGGLSKQWANKETSFIIEQ